MTVSGWTSMAAAGAGIQARRAHKELEKIRMLMEGDIMARLNQQWHAIIEERDRVWKEVADRMWRQGWEAGYKACMEDERGKRPE